MRAHWINNEWTQGEATGTIPVENPATQEILDEVPDGTEADAHRAVEAAKAPFREWRKLSAVERAHMLHEVSRRAREHWDELVELLTLEQGKPVPENEEEMEWTADTFDYYAELGRHIRGRVVPSGEPETQLNMVLKEPYGVVAAIIPWNYPMLLMAWKVAAALAAGNTVVIKPSELTPLTTLLFVEKCMSHLPPGVVNVVTGYGQPVGEALVKHPDVPVIAFTGSLATGQRISTLAAPMIKRLHLELGGKDAFVVGPDIDVESTAKALAYSALLNAGQVCTSSERVYVAGNVAGQFVEALVEEVSRLRLGPGIEPTTDIGPMIGDAYRSKVERHVEDARQKGARILIGGKRPAHLERGYFYEPTVLLDVNHDMLIMSEETFGPAIPLMVYDDFDQAIEWVNSSPYGLGAVLRTNDMRLAKKFYEEVRAGTIWINDPLTDNYAGPFGGMKLSGNARELGAEGLESFLETKHVHWDFSADPKDWWYPY
ncbi:MAG TPA: aldehyde dehydrogenase family protein [Aggregatilineales bacterium]|nr:aldehyde dehydrogenase family protein [Aggregatilineales bacterium]